MEHEPTCATPLCSWPCHKSQTLFMQRAVVSYDQAMARCQRLGRMMKGGQILACLFNELFNIEFTCSPCVLCQKTFKFPLYWATHLCSRSHIDAVYGSTNQGCFLEEELLYYEDLVSRALSPNGRWCSCTVCELCRGTARSATSSSSNKTSEASTSTLAQRGVTLKRKAEESYFNHLPGPSEFPDLQNVQSSWKIFFPAPNYQHTCTIAEGHAVEHMVASTANVNDVSLIPLPQVPSRPPMESEKRVESTSSVSKSLSHKKEELPEFDDKRGSEKMSDNILAITSELEQNDSTSSQSPAPEKIQTENSRASTKISKPRTPPPVPTEDIRPPPPKKAMLVNVLEQNKEASLPPLPSPMADAVERIPTPPQEKQMSVSPTPSSSGDESVARTKKAREELQTVRRSENPRKESPKTENSEGEGREKGERRSEELLKERTRNRTLGKELGKMSSDNKQLAYEKKKLEIKNRETNEKLREAGFQNSDLRADIASLEKEKHELSMALAETCQESQQLEAKLQREKSGHAAANQRSEESEKAAQNLEVLLEEARHSSEELRTQKEALSAKHHDSSESEKQLKEKLTALEASLRTSDLVILHLKEKLKAAENLEVQLQKVRHSCKALQTQKVELNSKLNVSIEAEKKGEEKLAELEVSLGTSTVEIVNLKEKLHEAEELNSKLTVSIEAEKKGEEKLAELEVSLGASKLEIVHLKEKLQIAEEKFSEIASANDLKEEAEKHAKELVEKLYDSSESEKQLKKKLKALEASLGASNVEMADLKEKLQEAENLELLLQNSRQLFEEERNQNDELRAKLDDSAESEKKREKRVKTLETSLRASNEETLQLKEKLQRAESYFTELKSTHAAELREEKETLEELKTTYADALRMANDTIVSRDNEFEEFKKSVEMESQKTPATGADKKAAEEKEISSPIANCLPLSQILALIYEESKQMGVNLQSKRGIKAVFYGAVVKKCQEFRKEPIREKDSDSSKKEEELQKQLQELEQKLRVSEKRLWTADQENQINQKLIAGLDTLLAPHKSDSWTTSQV